MGRKREKMKNLAIAKRIGVTAEGNTEWQGMIPIMTDVKNPDYLYGDDLAEDEDTIEEAV
jgi:hypothetical protein